MPHRRRRPGSPRGAGPSACPHPLPSPRDQRLLPRPAPGDQPRRLRTARGEFAVLDRPPTGEVPLRGTVLLLPGYTGSKEDFTPVLAPLAARGYRAVAVDGRGQHASDGPADDEAAYAQDELAKDDAGAGA